MSKIKEYTEKRNELVESMQEIVNKAKQETRSFCEDEILKYNKCKEEIRSIDTFLEIEEESRSFECKSGSETKQEDVELRAFDTMLRNGLETRSDVNFVKSDNGAIIPKSISNKIIEKVKELSPIYNLATKFSAKGELVFPIYDESEQKIRCAYQTEFVSMSATAGKFKAISLTGFLAGALSKVPMSLVNNPEFDLVGFVINKVAQAISEFLEKELLVGTQDKMSGILSAKQKITAPSAYTITADELIDLQTEVPQVYQKGACWIMHKSTLRAIRKLKDSDNNYILNRDLTSAFGWELLGHPVFISENMPVMNANNSVIAYGDMSGLYIKFSENISIQVLREKYADEHAIGIIGWIEADSKIVETQKIAVMNMSV